MGDGAGGAPGSGETLSQGNKVESGGAERRCPPLASIQASTHAGIRVHARTHARMHPPNLPCVCLHRHQSYPPASRELPKKLVDMESEKEEHMKAVYSFT